MSIIEREEPGSFFEYSFYCPGCENHHGIRTASWPEPEGLNDKDKKLFEEKWTFDGNMIKPTLSPSIKITIHPKTGEKFTQCHFFVKAGMIQYLNDCRHELKGKTVPMEPG